MEAEILQPRQDKAKSDFIIVSGFSFCLPQKSNNYPYLLCQIKRSCSYQKHEKPVQHKEGFPDNKDY